MRGDITRGIRDSDQRTTPAAGSRGVRGDITRDAALVPEVERNCIIRDGDRVGSAAGAVERLAVGRLRIEVEATGCAVSIGVAAESGRGL